MPLIDKLESLRHESVRCRTIAWHHPNDGAAVLLESGTLFLARYVLDRPHAQSPWWANLSSMLNDMADAVLNTLQSHVGQPLDGSCRGRRLSMMTAYCRWMLNKPGEPVRTVSRSRRELDGSPGQHAWFAHLLFPETGRITSQNHHGYSPLAGFCLARFRARGWMTPWSIVL